MTRSTAPHVYRAIAAITRAFARSGIAKSQRNEVDGYAFRHADIAAPMKIVGPQAPATAVNASRSITSAPFRSSPRPGFAPGPIAPRYRGPRCAKP